MIAISKRTNLVRYQLGFVYLAATVLIILASVACTGADSNSGEEPTPTVNGPALVMFYTDN